MPYAVPTRERLPALIGALSLQVALLAALMAGLAIRQAPRTDDALATFTVPPPSPPRPRPTPPPQRNTRPEGEAAPPSLRAQATQVVAPPPVVPVPLPPPPVVVAPRAGDGAAPRQGAAEVPGPGSGAGGIGDGTGAGGAGDGDGGGAGDETPPRWRRGQLRDSDYPLSEGEAGVGGTVSVRYLVGIDGRVTDCRATRSSGSPLLDSTTCRLIQQRFRFEPSRDGRGRPVPAYVVEEHSWVIER